MHLTKENLNLYRIASNEQARYALTGVFVNPRAKVTAACNGSMLVEVTAPSGAAGDKESKPFILPAKVAQQIVKELGDGAKAHVGNDKGKPVIALANGKKTTPISFEPIDAVFPDYAKGDHFTGQGDPVKLTCDSEYLQDVLKAAALDKTVRVTLFADRIRFESEPRDVNMAVGKLADAIDGTKLNFNAEYLRQLLIATAIGKTVTLSMFNDRLRIESKKDDGQTAKGVIMCCGQPAPAPETEARVEKTTAPVAEPKVEKPAVNPQPKTVAPEHEPAFVTVPRFRRWGRYRKPFVTKDGDAEKPPTERQRILYTYFLRRHEEEITPEILASTDFVGKIEELKKGLSFDPNFATWHQWMKVNYLLLDQRADAESVCEVLNGIVDKKSASEAISSLSLPAPRQPLAARQAGKKPAPSFAKASEGKPAAA